MAHPISIYFFHSGKGQSIAVRFEPNDWIVIDADEVGPRKRRRNPALDLLRRHEAEDDFRLRAVVLSHFHSDHYRGLPCLIRYFEGKLGMILLPTTWKYFGPYLEGEAQHSRNPRLRELMELITAFDRRGQVDSVNAFDFLSPVHGEGVGDEEPWFFCLHPRQKDVIDSFGEGGLPNRPRRRRVAVPTLDWMTTKANDYSYMFSVGYGRSPRHQHVLLTADISGRSFGRLTGEMRDNWIPRLNQGLPGAPANLSQLLVPDSEKEAGGRRIRPIQGLSVPHHGSAHDAIHYDVLRWWLGGPDACWGNCPVAVVQGDRNAFRPESFEQLRAAEFRIFASSRPLRILEWEDAKPEERLPRAPEGLVHSFDTCDDESGFLALHGGKDGLHRIEAESFYEVRPTGEARWHDFLDDHLVSPAP